MKNRFNRSKILIIIFLISVNLGMLISFFGSERNYNWELQAYDSQEKKLYIFGEDISFQITYERWIKVNSTNDTIQLLDFSGMYIQYDLIEMGINLTVDDANIYYYIENSTNMGTFTRLINGENYELVQKIVKINISNSLDLHKINLVINTNSFPGLIRINIQLPYYLSDYAVLPILLDLIIIAKIAIDKIEISSNRIHNFN